MQRKHAVICFAAIGSIIAWGAESWRNKPYAEWTNDEIAQILSKSPWAQEVTVNPRSRESGMGRRRGGMGGPRIGMGGPRIGGMGIPGIGYPRGGGTGGPDMGGGQGRGGAMPSFTATIRWQSALPVQEALARQAGKTKLDEPQDGQASTYVIAVSGLPQRMGRNRRNQQDTDTDAENNGEDQLERLKSGTVLNIKGKEPLRPEKVERADDGSVLFTFSKANPITVKDKEVDFVTRLGQTELKRKFKLSDMVYQGKLEL